MDLNISVANWDDGDGATEYQLKEFERCKPYLIRLIRDAIKHRVPICGGDLVNVYDDSMDDFIERFYVVIHKGYLARKEGHNNLLTYWLRDNECEPTDPD